MSSSFKRNKAEMVQKWQQGTADLIIPLSQIGKAAMEAAQIEYEKNIQDLPSNEIDNTSLEAIRKYYRHGLEWPTYAGRYYGDGDGEWCGTLPAYCYGKLGDFILDAVSVDVYAKTAVRKKRFASCYRLYRYKNKYGLEVTPSGMQPGDLVVVGEHPQGHAWGRHITMCNGLTSNDTFDTIEGNGIGKLPHGRRGEGVVKNTRPFSDVTFALRLKPEAYDTPDHIKIVQDTNFERLIKGKAYE